MTGAEEPEAGTPARPWPSDGEWWSGEAPADRQAVHDPDEDLGRPEAEPTDDLDRSAPDGSTPRGTPSAPAADNAPNRAGSPPPPPPPSPPPAVTSAARTRSDDDATPAGVANPPDPQRPAPRPMQADRELTDDELADVWLAELGLNEARLTGAPPPRSAPPARYAPPARSTQPARASTDPGQVADAVESGRAAVPPNRPSPASGPQQRRAATTPPRPVEQVRPSSQPAPATQPARFVEAQQPAARTQPDQPVEPESEEGPDPRRLSVTAPAASARGVSGRPGGSSPGQRPAPSTTTGPSMARPGSATTSESATSGLAAGSGQPGLSAGADRPAQMAYPGQPTRPEAAADIPDEPETERVAQGPFASPPKVSRKAPKKAAPPPTTVTASAQLLPVTPADVGRVVPQQASWVELTAPPVEAPVEVPGDAEALAVPAPPGPLPGPPMGPQPGQPTSATGPAVVPAQRTPPAPPPAPPAAPTRLRQTPRRPSLSLAGLVVLALAIAFFAWVSAEPFWLAVGHGHTGMAIVLPDTDECRAAFVASDGSFSVSSVEVAGLRRCAHGAAAPAHMVSARSQHVYITDTAGINARWSIGFGLIILCGLAIAAATGGARLTGWRGALTTGLSLLAPALVTAAMLIQSY